MRFLRRTQSTCRSLASPRGASICGHLRNLRIPNYFPMKVSLDRTKETSTQGRRGAERATYQNGMDETQTSLLVGFDLQPSESSQKHFLCVSAPLRWNLLSH